MRIGGLDDRMLRRMTLARFVASVSSTRPLPLQAALWLGLLGASLPAQELDPMTNLVLVHFNDFHGQVQPLEKGLGGYAVLASCIAEQRRRASARRAGLLLLDSGDWFQGTPEGNESRGSLVVRLMNRLHVDAAVLGNHEFDFGHLQAQRLTDQAAYPILAANLHAGARHTVVPWVKPYVVKVVAGMRIAIFGLITQRTRLVSTGPFGDLRYGDEIEALSRWMPRLEADSDAIVLLSHCGLAKDKELAENFPRVQLILGGHSHTSLKRPVRVGPTWIVQTGARSQEIDRVQLRVDPLSRRIYVVQGENLPLLASRYSPDPEVTRWLAHETADIRKVWDRPLGRLEGDFGSRRAYGSTPAGNLVADLIREAGKAQIGVQNKGGLRTRLRTGPLTLRLTYQLLPFQNHVVAMDLTGSELRAVLSEGIESAGRPFEVSGMRYEILRGSEGPELGRAWLASGQQIRDDEVYRVATNSFLAGGGDGAKSFKAGHKIFHCKALLRELFVAKAKRDPVIEANGEKRIVLVEGR